MCALVILLVKAMHESLRITVTCCAGNCGVCGEPEVLSDRAPVASVLAWWRPQPGLSGEVNTEMPNRYNQPKQLSSESHQSANGCCVVR